MRQALLPATLPATLIAALALVPAACSREASGGGTAVETPANPADWAGLKGFTAVEVTGPDNVIVTRGDFAVTVEGDRKAIDRLEIKQDGETLEIGRKKRLGMSWSEDKVATIRVSLPAIRSVEATGSGDISVDRADGGPFEAELTGSGNLSIAAASVAALKAELTGSGDMTIAGTAQSIDLSLTGSGNFDGGGLQAGGGEVSLLGSGDAGFASDGAVDISILGSGNVSVKGKAQCKKNIMGSGEARCAP
ncbi:MAG: head GIN domain-containing protein [Sphingobium sp.]